MATDHTNTVLDCNTVLELDRWESSRYHSGMSLLRQYREAKKLSQVALAELANTSQPQIDRLEKSQRKLTKEWAERLAPHLGITAEGLLFGSAPVEHERVPVGQEFTPDPDPDRAMAEASVGIVPDGVPADAILQPDFHAGLGGGGVPLQVEVTTPDGQNFTGEGVRDWWRIPPQVLGSVNLRPRSIRAFQAQGDSMIPTIDDGDVVFADVSHRVPSPPGLYVLDDGFGGVLVKRLSVETMPGEEPVMVRVASDNEAYPTHMREADNVRIIGRYIGMFTMRNRR